MRKFDFEQYSDAWWAVRRGVPTASEFGSILTPKTMKLSAGANGYICRLIGDVFDVEYPRKDTVATAAMRRGTEMEPEARRYYELHSMADVRQVGFCLTDDGRFGCSPDALVGEDGVLELKAPSPATHAEYLLDGVLPSDYAAQVHGHLIVTGRAWCDFMSYCPGLPPFITRVTPSEYTENLRKALDLFAANYAKALDRIKAMQPTSPEPLPLAGKEAVLC